MKSFYIGKKEVARIFNKSASTITRWSKEIPDFPKPFLLGPNTVMWDRREIEDYINERKKIRANLKKTHICIFNYPFIWEGWQIKTQNSNGQNISKSDHLSSY